MTNAERQKAYRERYRQRVEQRLETHEERLSSIQTAIQELERLIKEQRAGCRHNQPDRGNEEVA